MNTTHTFHIPVMGTGFTIDTPQRVARYGISSVISLVDDSLIEDMRRIYCAEWNEEYTPIRKFDEDWRARRITEYLNLVDRIVHRQIETLRASAFETGSDICTYFELLPETSPLRKLYNAMLGATDPQELLRMQEKLRHSIQPGAINVNIMTKLDRINYDKACEPLPEKYSDALSALRGFAQSTVKAGIVLSAGLNRRLYSYMEEFEDFFTDASGRIKKQIILKVSDYRSAVTQGKFFAKKGLWVSEYRVESGLNCGGHAFAGNGYLMGPVLKEFFDKKQELTDQLTQICTKALDLAKKPLPLQFPEYRVTAQGGIGTFAEDSFLKRYFKVASTGWGTPFLLVPEATQVDQDTLQRLVKAEEKDVYLSDVSPLGVPFHNLRESASERNKREQIAAGRPGSPCPLAHLVSNTEFTPQPICTASRQYQNLKLSQLKKAGMTETELKAKTAEVTAKACICSDLGDAVYSLRQIEKPGNRIYPAICPGPNIAYFNRVVSLKEMVDHIYGRCNIMTSPARPHMFIKELQLNISFLQDLIEKKKAGSQEKKDADLIEFFNNLFEGISYYRTLVDEINEEQASARERIRAQLNECSSRLDNLLKSSGICLSATVI